MDDALRALRAKYEEMRAMRMEAANGSTVDPRARMRALAERFPGALREIDELALPSIEARIRELDAVLQERREPPRWARISIAYHAWMRAVLALRRAAGKTGDRASAARFLDGYEVEIGGPSAEELRSLLDSALKPPAGRLNALVFASLGERYDASPAELEDEAFPGSADRRRARPLNG